MLSWFLRPIRHIAKALLDDYTPKQLALAVALGAVIGLVPKGNLIAIALTVLLFSLRVNLGAGLASALAFSAIGVLIDPLADHMGRSVLVLAPLQEPFAKLYRLPIVPWTAFNNTVVMGSLLLGLLQMYPTYLITKKLAEKYQANIVEKIRRYRVTRVLLGAEIASHWR